MYLEGCIHRAGLSCRKVAGLRKKANLLIIRSLCKSREMFSSTHWILKLLYISSIAIGFDMHREGNVDISPLVSLMKEQVQKLKNLAISAITLSGIKEDVKAVDKDVFSVIYRSPEAFLKIVQ